MRNIIGIGLRGDSRSFVNSMDRATSKVITMHHRISQGSRMFKKYERDIHGVDTALRKYNRRMAALRHEKAYRQADLMKDPQMAQLTRSLADAARAKFRTQDYRSVMENEAVDLENRMNNRFQAIGWASAGALVAGFASFAIADKIADVLASTVEEASKFQLQMANVAFVGKIEVGSDAFTEMRGKLMDTAMNSMFTPEEIGKAMYALQSTGQSRKASLEALKSLTDLATLGQAQGVSMEQSATILGIGLQKLKIPKEIKGADRAAYVADTFAKFTQMSPGGFKDIRPLLDSIGVATKRVSMDNEELFTMAAMLKKTGYSAKRSGQKLEVTPNSIIKMMADLMLDKPELASRGAKRRHPALDLLGFVQSDFRKADGKTMREEYEILFALADKYEKLAKKVGDADAKAALNKATTNKTQTDLLVALSSYSEIVDGKELKGIEAFRHMLKDMRSKEGIAAKGATVILSQFDSSIKLLKGVIDSLSVELGTPIIEALTPVILAFKDALQSLAKFLRKNPVAKKFIVGFLVLSAVLFAGLGIILMVAGGVGLLVGLFTLMGPAIIILAKAVAVASVAFVALGAVAVPTLVAIAKAISNPSKKMKEFAKGANLLFKALSSFTRDGDEFLISKALGDDLEDAGMLETYKSIVRGIKAVETAFDRFSGTVTRFWNNSGPVIKEQIDSILDSFGKTFDTGDMFKGGESDTFSAIADALSIIFILLITTAVIALWTLARIAEVTAVLITIGMEYSGVLTAIAYTMGAIAIILTIIVISVGILLAALIMVGLVVSLALFGGLLAVPALIAVIGTALYTWLVEPISKAISELKLFLGLSGAANLPTVAQNESVVPASTNSLSANSTSPVGTPPISPMTGDAPNNTTQNTQVAMDNNISIQGSLASPEAMAEITTQLTNLMRLKLSDELTNNFDRGEV